MEHFAQYDGRSSRTVSKFRACAGLTTARARIRQMTIMKRRGTAQRCFPSKPEQGRCACGGVQPRHLRSHWHMYNSRYARVNQSPAM